MSILDLGWVVIPTRLILLCAEVCIFPLQEREREREMVLASQYLPSQSTECYLTHILANTLLNGHMHTQKILEQNDYVYNIGMHDLLQHTERLQ